MAKWIRRLLASVLVLGALATGAFVLYVGLPAHSVPDLEPVDRYVYLNQGWTESVDSPGRQTYYYTGQGATLPQGATHDALRYDWFVHLEMPLGKKRFADPDHMRAWRFLVDPEPTAANPHQLPVGFARHFEPTVGEYMLDLTCAACHSGEIHYKRDGEHLAVRIDGGQAMHDFAGVERGSFASTLLASLISTRYNPMKFDRFGRNVIGDSYPQGKTELKRNLSATIKRLMSSGQNNPLRHLYPVEEGYGRTDALSRIANTVFGDHLVAANYQVGDAPVSYPYVWNIWKFDWVQYNGSVRQPLSRNIGESLGVGARVLLTDDYGRPLPPEQRFSSSTSIPNLQTIEHTLQTLQPPRWPEAVFGDVDADNAEAGKALFEQHCQGCHGPHVASPARQQANAPGKPSASMEWLIEVIPVEHIGTDPAAATGFVERRYDLTPTGLTQREVAAALRPLNVRYLSREMRYHLSELIDLRAKGGHAVGALSDVLQHYPNPDTARDIELPRRSFAAIDSALDELSVAQTQHSRQNPPDAQRSCDQACHEQWLRWHIQFGEQHLEDSLAAIDVSSVSEGEGLNILGIMIKQKYYRDNNISYAQQTCLEGFGTIDLPQQVAGYKPRPLEGVWATPPFLHNGSVPSLYEMLLPPEQRTRRFFVGRRDFDPVHVGYVTEPSARGEGGFWLDTSIAGNRNTGHAFSATANEWAERHDQPLPPGVIGPLLSDKERWSLVEYLKVHRDAAPTNVNYTPHDCLSGDRDTLTVARSN
ncbi:MAG: di-heme-cytochrome C peroxidase [Pseudomonadota bacterium]